MIQETFPQTIRSNYFERRDLVVGPDEIVVIACMRNEYQRLPFFLEHYRRLGVTRFLLVDNDSSDRTQEFLAGQPDVDTFWTDTSYRGSSAGRLWMQELADTYATDRWVVTVDVDELLIYPGSETFTLRDLCAYLDDNDHAGLFTVMLDMYSDRPLSQTRYEPGNDFLDTCPYFETDTYSLSPGANPPFLNVSGGPRDRLFRANGEVGVKPAMKKIPLVRWRDGFSYMYSTHSHRFVQLSDVTGALLHFKFFDSFRSVAQTDAQRGDRRQQEHYSTYRESVANDVCFYGKQSRVYRGPTDLVRLGVMCSTERYATFLASRLRDAGAEPDVQDLLPEPVAPEGSLTLRSVAAVWPIVNNPAMPQYFGASVRQSRDHRLAFVEEMRRYVRLVDVKPDHLLIRLDEPALHRWYRHRLGLGVYVGQRLVRNVLIDGVEEALLVAEDSLEPSLYRLQVDLAGAAKVAGDAGPSIPVTVYLFDAEDDSRPGARPFRIDDADVRSEDLVIHHQSWFPGGGQVGREVGLRGAIGKLTDGRLRGWAYDADRDTFDVPVCVYINGRLARHAWPTLRRSDVDVFRKEGSSARGRGFLIDLPLGYFDRSDTMRIEVTIAGRNLGLRHSPLVLPGGVRSAEWDQASKSWIIDATG